MKSQMQLAVDVSDILPRLRDNLRKSSDVSVENHGREKVIILLLSKVIIVEIFQSKMAALALLPIHIPIES